MKLSRRIFVDQIIKCLYHASAFKTPKHSKLIRTKNSQKQKQNNIQLENPFTSESNNESQEKNTTIEFNTNRKKQPTRNHRREEEKYFPTLQNIPRVHFILRQVYLPLILFQFNSNKVRRKKEYNREINKLKKPPSTDYESNIKIKILIANVIVCKQF